jgi:hypothetical protein
MSRGWVSRFGGFNVTSVKRSTVARFVIWLFLSISFLKNTGVSFAQTPANDIIKAYESACKAIETYDVQLRVVTRHILTGKGAAVHEIPENDPRRTKTQIGESRQFYKRGSFRVELLENRSHKFPAHSELLVWNGEVEKELSNIRHFGEITGWSLSRNPEYGLAYHELFSSYSPGYSYVAMIRDRPPGSVSAIRESKYIVLAIPSAPETNTLAAWRSARLTLDPTKGFMPAKIEIFVHKKDEDAALYDRLENTLAEVLPGIWAPIRSSRTNFALERKSKFFGKPFTIQEISIAPERMAFNKSIDNSIFALDFPVGTLVQDNVAHTSYSIGAGNRKKYLEHVTGVGKSTVAELKKKSRLFGAKDERRMTYPRILVMLNVFLLFAVVSVGVYHRRRFQNQAQAPSEELR